MWDEIFFKRHLISTQTLGVYMQFFAWLGKRRCKCHLHLLFHSKDRCDDLFQEEPYSKTSFALIHSWQMIINHINLGA